MYVLYIYIINYIVLRRMDIIMLLFSRVSKRPYNDIHSMDTVDLLRYYVHPTGASVASYGRLLLHRFVMHSNLLAVSSRHDIIRAHESSSDPWIHMLYVAFTRYDTRAALYYYTKQVKQKKKHNR